MSRILIILFLCLASLAAAIHALSTTNCVKLSHHTFSWELSPSMNRVSFKAMFMPPYVENDILLHWSNTSALVFRIDAEDKSINEWTLEDGQFTKVGQQYFTRMMVMPMSEPMKMLHVEFTRVWEHGFDPKVDDDAVVLEYRLADKKDLDAKLDESITKTIKLYHGVDECGGDGGHHMEMPMAFYWSFEVMMIFKGWMTMNFREFVPAWIFTFAISFLLQVALWVFGLNYKTTSGGTTAAKWIVRAFAKVIVTILSIMQMLLMMTFNVPLLSAIVLGALIGWAVSFGGLQTALLQALQRIYPMFDNEKTPLIVNRGDTNEDHCC